MQIEYLKMRTKETFVFKFDSASLPAALEHVRRKAVDSQCALTAFDAVRIQRLMRQAVRRCESNRCFGR
jgi:hypothetical protein